MSPRWLLQFLPFPRQEEGQHGWTVFKEGPRSYPHNFSYPVWTEQSLGYTLLQTWLGNVVFSWGTMCPGKTPSSRKGENETGQG